MKSLISAILVAFSLFTSDSLKATTAMRAEDYIKLSAFSQRIVVVEVKHVKFRAIKTEEGIESREVTVVGAKVETIRGKDLGKEFVDCIEESRIVDRKKAARTQPSEIIDILKEDAPHQPAACKVGHRYLVIFLRDMTFFFEVPKDNDGWRDQIQEFEDAR